MLWWLWIPRKHLEPAQVMNIMCQVKIKLTNLGILKPVDLCHAQSLDLINLPINRWSTAPIVWLSLGTQIPQGLPHQTKTAGHPVQLDLLAEPGSTMFDPLHMVGVDGLWVLIHTRRCGTMLSVLAQVVALPFQEVSKKNNTLKTENCLAKQSKSAIPSATPQKSTTTSRGEKRPPFRTPQASPFSSAMCAPCHPTGSALPCRLTVLMNVEWTTPFGGLAWDSMGIHRQLWAYRHILGQHGPTNLQICRVSNFIAIQDQTAKTHHVLQLYT